MQTILNSFSLTISGLSLTYTVDGKRTVRTFDPHATCAFFEELKLIEGFDKDRNGEPVILFVQHICGQFRTGFALWFRFVQGFQLTERMAQIMVERLEMTKVFAKSHVILNRLMKPLQAA